MFSSNTTQVSSGGYEIQRSLRFNRPDSTYLNRTPASAGNRQTWTLSYWIKKSVVNQLEGMFRAGDFLVYFNSDTLRVEDTAGILRDTTQVFRDYSAWYHFVITLDTPNATANDRIKVYVNGSQITSFSVLTNPTQNQSLSWNNNVNHNIGTYASGTYHFGGYMTEVNFIDGQALTPSSFGEYNADTGVWQPKRYAGSYGTNGFYLNFSNNSNTTAATLGADYSGNGNNWTPNNFSVSAGAGNDSLVDSPTSYGTDTGVGGTVRGNYATLNPLQISTTFATISNGNLQYVDTTSGGSYRSAYSTVFASSGKYYFEATVSSVSGTPFPSIGIASPPPQNDTYIEQTITGYQGYGYYADGTKATNDTYTAFGAAYTAGDTVAVAVDIDAGKVWFAKNGTWQASGDPAAGTNPAFNIVTGRAYGFAVGNGSSATSIQMDCNFGQRPFAYTAPSGFKALNTQNLDTPTIGATTATQAGKYFNTILWTGDGSNPRAITGVGFQPDFSWLARRDIGYGFWLYDVLRGATYALNSQDTGTGYVYQQLNSFDTDGFTQAGSIDQGNNISGGQYVAWNWKANGTGVTNTSGSVTSTVSANTTSGFSVVRWTQPGSGTYTIGHGLGAAPAFIIMKSSSNTSNWAVYHKILGYTQYILLNGTGAAVVDSSVWVAAPTSSVFSQLVNYGTTGTSVAYCFSEVPGYSKFGSYVGNGSSDGVFVFCGFRPAWVLVKRRDGADDWHLFDDQRDGFNVTNDPLYPNASYAEGSGYNYLDLVSNGFKCRNNSYINNSGVEYIFAAFAEAPQKFALAR